MSVAAPVSASAPVAASSSVSDTERGPLLLRPDHTQVCIPEGADDRARAYYIGVLGMREIPRPSVFDGRGGMWLFCGQSEERPHANVHIGAESVPADFYKNTKAHIAYSIRNLLGLARHLRSHGYEVIDKQPLPGMRRFDTRDPFGNLVELIEYNIEPVMGTPAIAPLYGDDATDEEVSASILSNPVRLLRPDHTQVVIPNGEEPLARQFYIDFLGMKNVPRPSPEQDHIGGMWLYCGLQSTGQPHANVHIGTEAHPFGHFTCTRAHVAYSVRGLARWATKLRAAGYPVDTKAQLAGMRRFDTRDPFGNMIELIEYDVEPILGTKAPNDETEEKDADNTSE